MKVRFSKSQAGGNRIYHVTPEDVEVVLSRLPEETYKRLRAVHFNDLAEGNLRLGYTTNRGRKEIALCALPERMSFTRFLVKGQSPRQFGASRGSQWPKLAIRRFLLYDVLLHEIGHLQEIDPSSKNPRRKFAGETKAQEFAMYWCKRLWMEEYDHADPVHNKPSAKEISAL